MRLLIDANIVLDVLQNREPHVHASSLLWKLCETEQAEGFISALTFANLVYVMRRELSPERTNDILSMLRMVFSVVDLRESDMVRAAEMKWADFEDAVHAATAERIQADYIITRNIRDFGDSRIPALTPPEFLASCRFSPMDDRGVQ